MKIAIKFGDNDFGILFMSIMGTLKEKFEWEPGFCPSKEQVLLVVNELIIPHYRLYHTWCEKTDEELSQLKKYLERKLEHVMFNDEVDAHIKECDGWNNSETVILEANAHRRYIWLI